MCATGARGEGGGGRGRGREEMSSSGLYYVYSMLWVCVTVARGRGREEMSSSGLYYVYSMLWVCVTVARGRGREEMSSSGLYYVYSMLWVCVTGAREEGPGRDVIQWLVLCLQHAVGAGMHHNYNFNHAMKSPGSYCIIKIRSNCNNHLYRMKGTRGMGPLRRRWKLLSQLAARHLVSAGRHLTRHLV